MRYLFLITLLFSACALAKTPLYPPALHTGDTVALISSGSHAYKPSDIMLARKRLQALGLKVVDGKSIAQKDGYFAGTDALRAADINAMFENPAVKAIFEVRGGWGGARLLGLIDYNLIEKNPKIFMGFSDITSLLLAIHDKTGLITFHGPMGASYEWTRYTTEQLKAMLFRGEALTLKNPGGSPHYILHQGKATGEIMGGNLSVISLLLGTPYAPSFKNKILFVEDIGEEMYQIDRMLNQLKQAGILSELKGFIFGTCAHCTTEVADSFTLNQILSYYITPLAIPSWSGAMIGHQSDMFLIPIGATVTIDAETGTIKLQRPAVVL